MMKRVSILLVLTCLLILSSCTTKYSEENIELLCFGTSINVKLYHKGKFDFSPYVSYVKKTYMEYDRVSDRYTDYANTKGLYYLNRNSGEKIVIDSKLLDIIEYSIKNSTILSKNGSYAFNIAIGNASDIYHNIFDGYLGEEIDSTIFPSVEIVSLKYPVDLSEIRIFKDESSIIIPSGMSIDLGGIAKGYTTSIIARYLDESGIDYTIDAGQSSIITSIGNPYKKDNEFKIGLKHPDSMIDDARAFGTIILEKGKSISTSGDYQKYFIYEGKRYSHILNPLTNLPYDTDIRSIAIICDDIALGDIISTSLYAIGYDEAISYLEENEGIDAVIYKNDGTIFVSENLLKSYNKK